MHYIYLRARCPEHCELLDDMTACVGPLPRDTGGLALWNLIAPCLPNYRTQGRDQWKHYQRDV